MGIIIQIDELTLFPAHQARMALLAEVCGRGHPALWIFPCQAAPRNAEPVNNYTV